MIVLSVAPIGTIFSIRSRLTGKLSQLRCSTKCHYSRVAVAFNNQVPKQKLCDKLKSMLNGLGMHPHHLIPSNIYMKNEIPIAGCAHQAGTCRFGTNPKSSVLDASCKAHELDNLYVVDTSFFVSIGAVNPVLTAIANALRVGDHLLQRWK
jgi:choline dehydrogenase-like flavoprotein